MPSIRLKNWRRGIEDVEYLAAARRRGQHKLVTALLNAMIPRSLAETEAGAPVSWTEDGEKWLRARRILADVIVSGRAMPIPVRELAPPPEPRLQRVKRKARALLRRVGRKRLAAAAATSGLAVGGIIVLVLVIRRKSGRTPT